MIKTAFEPLVVRSVTKAVTGPGRIVRRPLGPPAPLHPGPLVNVWVTALLPSSLRLNWDAVPGATHYNISWWGQSRRTTNLTQGIPYLVGNNSYIFYLTAENEHGLSEPVAFAVRTPGS